MARRVTFGNDWMDGHSGRCDGRIEMDRTRFRAYNHPHRAGPTRVPSREYHTPRGSQPEVAF